MRLPAVFRLLAASLIASPVALLAQGAAPPEIELKVIQVPDPQKVAAPVRVGPVKDLVQVPDDFWTHASDGDLLLSNDQVNFVFGAVTPETAPDPNLAREGNILDVFTSPAAPENFQFFHPVLNMNLLRTVRTTALESRLNAKDGSGTVTAVAKDMTFADLAIETRYEMQRGWPGVLATTTIINDGKTDLKIPAIADLVGWGAMVSFVPGSGWVAGSHVLGQTEFVMGRLYDSHILIAPKEGSFKDLIQAPGSSVLIYEIEPVLKPGESRIWQRWILSAQKDPAPLFTFLQEQRAAATNGIIAGRVVERQLLPDGSVRDAAPVSNSEVRVTVANRKDLPDRMIGRPYIYTVTDDRGRFQLTLPPGEYNVFSTQAARDYVPNNLAIRVKPKTVSPIDLVVSPPSSLAFEVVDAETKRPIPAKISILPLRGSRDLDLGPPGGLRSGPSVWTDTGKGLVDVPEGNYRVVASRGPEYHVDEKRVRIERMKSSPLRLELRRAYPTEGWISADLGVMTNATPQSRTSPEDRVTMAAAEGVEWLVSADANTITDLAPAVQKLNLGAHLRTSQGLRLTPPIGIPRGEYLLFPLDACAAGRKLDLAAAFKAQTPKDVTTALRALCPQALLVASRPIFPSTGLLSVQGYDMETAAFPEKAEPFLDVDALQLWEGKRQNAVEPTLLSYLRSLPFNPQLSLMANSLAAGSFYEEPGYPRVFIADEEKDVRKLDPVRLAQRVRDGRVQMTNGPFIDVKVNGKGPGSRLSDTDGTIDVELRVFTPNWASVAAITINVNGAFARKFILPAGSYDRDGGRAFPREKENATFTLPVTQDSILQVMVDGDPALPQDPVNPFLIPTIDGTGLKGQRSMAVTGPIFIDADGDGEVTPDFSLPAPADGTDSPGVVPAF